MTDIDKFIEEKVIPFRAKALECFSGKHPHIFSMINAFLSDKNNYIGFQIMENDKVVGEYTLHLDGLNISNVDYGKLSSEIHHPFLGIIRPYAAIERSALERAVNDEGFMKEPFSVIAKYLPDITIKFLR